MDLIEVEREDLNKLVATFTVLLGRAMAVDQMLADHCPVNDGPYYSKQARELREIIAQAQELSA